MTNDEARTLAAEVAKKMAEYEPLEERGFSEEDLANLFVKDRGAARIGQDLVDQERRRQIDSARAEEARIRLDQQFEKMRRSVQRLRDLGF